MADLFIYFFHFKALRTKDLSMGKLIQAETNLTADEKKMHAGFQEQKSVKKLSSCISFTQNKDTVSDTGPA